MNDIVLAIDLALTFILSVFFGFLGLILLSALTSPVSRRGRSLEVEGRNRFLVLIPAHDEESSIGQTVASCREIHYDPRRFRIFVIADNCTDRTAEVARSAGAEVIERRDLSRKSKGYAIEDFLDKEPAGNLEADPFDALVLIDADTCVAPDLLQRFDANLVGGASWIQGYYTVRNADASWRTRLMTYAFSLINGVWPRGLDKIGLGVGLKGNGMCFGAQGLRRVPWRAYGLVEDMEFAWKLKSLGEKVSFDPEAVVYGEMVSRGDAGAASQRLRWEIGRKGLRQTFRPAILRSTQLSSVQKVLYLIDLHYPPMSRLAAYLAVALSLTTISAVAFGKTTPMMTLAATQAAFGLILAGYVMSPLVVMRLPVRYLGSLFYLPYYMLWKVVIRRAGKPKGWVRTPREASRT